ncbi:MAG: C1 family peptidase [Raineya sp.]
MVRKIQIKNLDFLLENTQKQAPNITHFIWVMFLCVFSAYSQTRMGCKLDKNAYENILPSYNPLRGEQKIPEMYSLKKFVPKPQNQGDYGTCVAWTSAYYARSIMLAQKNFWENSKEINEKAGSPFFVYEQIKSYSDTQCQEGAGLIVALEALKQYGTVPIKRFNRSCGQPIGKELLLEAENYRIAEYRRLFLANSKDKISPIKKTIAANKPVVIGLQCFSESFIKAKDSIWKPTEVEIKQLLNEEGGHALCVVGYDDKLKAFEIVNSWGTNWGNKGFLWIAYEVFEQVCFEAYEMYEAEEPIAQIVGEVKLTLSAGIDMPLRLKDGYYESYDTYQTGTLIRLLVSNQEPIFVYAFTSDLNGNSQIIFPKDQMTPLLYQSQQTILPDEQHYIQLVDNNKTDYFCILYSKEKLHLPSIISQLDSMEGNLQERLTKILGSKMIPPQQISFQEIASIKFAAKTEKATVLPLIVAVKKR